MAAVAAIPLKGKTSLDIDLEEVLDPSFPVHALKEVLIQGLKAVLGRKMTKIAKELTDDILSKAKENWEDLKAGRVGRSKATKGISGAVKTEARRLARLMVKDELRKQGLKVSHYSAAEITAAADALIESNPSIVAKAEQAIAERSIGEITVDVTKLHADPALVAKAEAAKAKKKAAGKPASAGQLSAAQAGRTKPTAHPSH